MISKPEKQLGVVPASRPVMPKLNLSFRLKDKRRRTIYGVIMLLMVTTLATVPTIIPKGVNLVAATQGLIDNIRIMFLHPAASNKPGWGVSPKYRAGLPDNPDWGDLCLLHCLNGITQFSAPVAD